MGIFTKSRKDTTENLYEKNIKKNLKEKDGFIHVILIDSFSKFWDTKYVCDDKYTNHMDMIISSMQLDGYVIVDIKIHSDPSGGFHTLVMYK